MICNAAFKKVTVNNQFVLPAEGNCTNHAHLMLGICTVKLECSSYNFYGNVVNNRGD
jgi:hypothetical protein